MKKILTLFLSVILLTMIHSAHASDVIINSDGSLYQPQKKSFFDGFKKKKKIIAPNLENKGYYGNLPDVQGEFEYKKETIQTPSKNFSEKDIQDGFLLDAPLGDPVFLDVIIKKDKNSDYINDIIKIKFTLEKLRKCIMEEANIQLFNANVNVLDLQTTNLEKKYINSANSMTSSFYAIRHVNYSAKMLGNLKYDANFYSRYMPVSDSVYSSGNISSQSAALLEEIEKTIYEIGNAK